MIGAGSSAHALESRSYAIEWFSLGSYSQDGDCVGGVNPPTREQYAKSFELLGYSPADVKKLMDDYAGEDDIAASWIGEGSSNHFFDEVTHWMPIPEGPAH